jgi:hypothetical protein
MKAYGGVEMYTQVFLTSALVGGDWSASHTGIFTPRERTPGTHWIGDCVSRSGSYGEIKIFDPTRIQTPTTWLSNP